MPDNVRTALDSDEAVALVAVDPRLCPAPGLPPLGMPPGGDVLESEHDTAACSNARGFHITGLLPGTDEVRYTLSLS